MSTVNVAPGARMVFDDAAAQRVIAKIENAAVRATVTELDVYLGVIGDSAHALWYKQVDKKTGLSGQISGGVIAVSDTKIRGIVGTSDTRREKGKPLIVYIRRPGPLSTKRRPVRESEKNALRAAGKRVPKYIEYPNPKASDYGYLATELINKPANAGKRELRKVIRAQIVALYRR